MWLRFTIRQAGTQFSVFAMKPQRQGYTTDGASIRVSWFVSKIAKPRFTGTYSECMTFIRDAGGMFMTEHGIPC